MSGLADLFVHIPKLCSSCAFAAAATIFYKKTFREDKLHIVGAFSILGLILEYYSKNPTYPVFGTSASLTLLACLCYRNQEWLKTAMKIDLYCTFLFALIDARFGLGEMIGLQYWKYLRIVTVAIPQFLRKPLWLKTKLQDLRSILGPIYILYVSSYVMSRDINDAKRLQQIGYVAMMSSIIAGVCFRPDNSAVLDLLAYLWKVYCDVVRMIFRPEDVDIEHVPYKTKRSERRYYHGRLMVCSLGCCTIMSAADIFFR